MWRSSPPAPPPESGSLPFTNKVESNWIGKTRPHWWTPSRGLLDYGENHNHDYFGQYINQDYSKIIFWVWKHDAFILHFSPTQHFVFEIFEFPLKKIHKMFKSKIMYKNVSSCSISMQHLMNKTNLLKKLRIIIIIIIKKIVKTWLY